MQSISILGCGWLGKALAIDLASKGYRVKGSTTSEHKLADLDTHHIMPFLVRFDPYPQGECLEEFFNSDILIITIPPKRKSGQTVQYRQQVEAVLQQAARGTVKAILFISSTSVYPELNRVVTETDADPESYLVEIENILRSNSAFKTTILRFGGLVGPDRHPGKFLAGKKDLAGGNNPVNMIHRDDCIAIIDKIIGQNVWNEVFNACSDQHPSKKEYYGRASAELGLEPPEFSDHQAPFKIVSSEKLKQALSYQFAY
jgi:nucleoside-diphosphate-sugar epimerase